MPSVFTRLWVAHFCSWMGLMCVILYYTEFFGEIMYQGMAKIVIFTQSHVPKMKILLTSERWSKCRKGLNRQTKLWRRSPYGLTWTLYTKHYCNVFIFLYWRPYPQIWQKKCVPSFNRKFHTFYARYRALQGSQKNGVRCICIRKFVINGSSTVLERQH